MNRTLIAICLAHLAFFLASPLYASPAAEAESFGFAGKPISLANGTETLTRTDLSVGTFYPIRIKRSYSSGASYDSPLGYGWAHNYDVRLYTYPDGSVVIRKETGWKRKFTVSGSAYVTPAGEYGVLVRNADESFTYTLKDGSRQEFDPRGRLERLIDAQGASLVLTYEADTRAPLEGLLPSNVDQSTALTVAYDYRVKRIAEQDPAGHLTGVAVDFYYSSATGRLLGFADHLGRGVEYGYDSIGNLISVVSPGGTASYGYTDAVGKHRLTRIDEGEGEHVNTYDPAGRVTRQTHSGGTIDIAYLAPQRKATVTTTVKDGAGATLNTAIRTVEFDSQEQVIKSTDALGNEARYTRNGLTLVTREEYWENSGTVVVPSLTLKSASDFAYDSQGNLTSRSENVGTPQERTAISTYHATFGKVLTQTSKSVVALGQSQIFGHGYDASGNRISTTVTGLLGDGSAFSYTTSYQYNAAGRLTQIDGPRTGVNDIVSFGYDGAGHLTAIARPLSGTTTFADFDGLGRPRHVTDPNGAVTSLTYDANGKVLTVKAPGDSQPTRIAYLSAGCTSCGGAASEIDTVTLPDGTLIDYDYDLSGNLSKISDSFGNSVNYGYDSQGHRLSEQIRDPQGALQQSLTFQYDALGRLSKIVNPDSSFSQFGYDGRGQCTSVKDPRGNTTSYQYDPAGQLTATVQPGSIGTGFAYDAHGNLTAVTDANNHATLYYYDDLDRVYRTVSPDSGTTSYTYDAAGNLTSQTDAKNVTIQYQYDAENRLTRIDFPTDTDIVYGYDACVNGKGRLCSAVDQSGSSAYEYTAKGQLAKETKTLLGVPYITSYAYDSNGNPTSTTYPSGRIVATAYSFNQPTGVTSNGGNIATNIAYQPFGGIKALTYGNGLTRTVGYDNQYRIASIQTGSVQNLTYGYDANGNVTAIANTLDASKNKSYGYDALERLSSATGPWGSIGWSYDPVGNRLTQTDSAGTASYNYQTGSNRLASVAGPEPATFTHDANGNTLAENGNSFTYDQNQRLIHAAAAQTGDYLYNAWGQRATKTVGGVTTLFHFDQRGQLIGESDAGGAVQAEYLYLDGQPLAKIDAMGVHYLHPDHLGTPVLMTNSIGEKVWEIESRPFGDAASINGTASLNLRFPGQYFDGETGNHYNYFRDYNPGLGRYIESDPIGLAGGINSFVYVRGNPINYVDPYGLFGEGRLEGNKWGNPLGHSDFLGSDRFDFNKEDRGWTNPYLQTYLHFRNSFEVEGYLKDAIRRCDKGNFERYMHQGQDVFSHYNQGYEGALNAKGVIGHLFGGRNPDQNFAAWLKAYEWTERMLYAWDKNCACK